MGRSKAKPVRNKRGREAEENSFVLSSTSSTTIHSTATATAKPALTTATHLRSDNTNDLVDSDSEVEGNSITAIRNFATKTKTNHRLRKKSEIQDRHNDSSLTTNSDRNNGEEKKEDLERQHDHHPKQGEHQDGDDHHIDGAKTRKEMQSSLPRKPDSELEIVKCRRKKCKTILKFTEDSQVVKNRRRCIASENAAGAKLDVNGDGNGNVDVDIDSSNDDRTQQAILCTFTLLETSIETQTAASIPSNPSLEEDRNESFIYTIKAHDSVIQLLKQYSKKQKTKKNWDPILPSLQHDLIRMEIQQYTSTATNTLTNTFEIKLRFILTAKAYQHCSPYRLSRKVPLRRVHSQKKVNDKYMAIILQEALGILMEGTCLDELLPIVSHDKQSQRDKQRSRVMGANEEVGDVTARIVYNVIDNVHSHRIETNTGSECATAISNEGSASISVLENNCSQVLEIGSTNRCKSDAEIPGLVPKLRKYQEAAVKWMLQRERGEYQDKGWELAWVLIHNDQDGTCDNINTTQGLELAPVCPLYKVKSPFPAGSIFYNPFTGWIVDSYEAARVSTIGNGSAVRGGILAESMGLGTCSVCMYVR